VAVARQDADFRTPRAAHPWLFRLGNAVAGPFTRGIDLSSDSLVARALDGLDGVSEDDLIDFTPELRAEAERVIAGHRLGPIYTPAVPFDPNGPVSTLMVMGGSNWPGGAYDPESHIVYVTASVGVNSMTICRYAEGSAMPHGI